MERRNFFKLVGTASGGVLTGACGNQARELLPILVPEKQIVPGVEAWHPSVCRECSAGCGIIVRVMEAEREIELEGEKVRQPLAAIKKIEGNPLDPVSGGRLCARGQAALQALYHPDRLRGPQRRSGERGEAAFQAISWDEALGEATGILSRAVESDPKGIVYLTQGEGGTRTATVSRFLEAIGGAPASTTGIGDFVVERQAARLVYGWQGLPVYEIQDATYVLSIGADFLGGWASPVFYARRFGHLRQGRREIRGRLVHAESRFSQTAWSADRWLPVRPGGEMAFALAVGHLLIAERGVAPAGLPEVIRQSFATVDLERAVEVSGIPLRRLREVVRDLAESPAPVVVAGASIVQSNSLAAVVAGNALNLVLGNVGKSGGVMPPAASPLPELEDGRPAHQDLFERLEAARVVLLDGVNPVYLQPACAQVLAQAQAVISFAPIIDDSAAYADLVLPDHSSLEAAAAVIPQSSPVSSLTGSRAYVQPLYDTRATEGVLVQLAENLGKQIEVATPRSAYQQMFEVQPAEDWESAREFARYCERQGGCWEEARTTEANISATLTAPLELREAEFEGDAAEYPYHFQPYPSLQFGDGNGAHLPWLQEMPDPASSAMWNLPVEIDPGTAAKLDLSNGQIVRVTSPAGELEAPVYVNPAAIPGVVSMAIGQGHTHYGRYASGRGANPLAIVGRARERETGVPALGSTRVKIEKVSGEHRLVQFSIVDREPHLKRL